MKVFTLKMPFKTNHFNKGQKVFVQEMSGNQACKVRGRFRSKGRRISAWIKWKDEDIDIINFKEIEINDVDFNNIMN